MKLLKIDETGLFIEDVIVEEIPKIILRGVEANDPMYIQTPCEGGFIHPRWNGTEWIEGASQEVLDAIEAEKHKLLPPTQDQRIKDLENMVVGLMDVILMGGM